MKHGLYLALSDYHLIANLIGNGINGTECIHNDTHLDDIEKIQQILLLFIDNCQKIEGKNSGIR